MLISYFDICYLELLHNPQTGSCYLIIHFGWDECIWVFLFVSSSKCVAIMRKEHLECMQITLERYENLKFGYMLAD